MGDTNGDSKSISAFLGKLSSVMRTIIIAVFDLPGQAQEVRLHRDDVVPAYRWQVEYMYGANGRE